MTRIPVDELRYGHTDVKPIVTDWTRTLSDEYDDYTWKFWEAFNYEILEQTYTLVTQDGMAPCAGWLSNGNKVVLDEDDEESDGIDPDVRRALYGAEPSLWGSEGPMMNYRYPLAGFHGDPVQLAYKLRNVPVCLVEYEDEFALALTGGGMDLSWEICEAYTIAGFLPPVHFDLPGMAGRGENELDRYLIRAVERSLIGMRERTQRDLEHLYSRFQIEPRRDQ